MDLGRNSSEISVGVNPVTNDAVFVLVIITLTLLITFIFCTIYRISANEENIVRFNMSGDNPPGIVAPHNTPNDE